MAHSDYQVTVRHKEELTALIRWLNSLSINWEPRDSDTGEDYEGTYYDYSFDTIELTWRKELELSQKPWVLVFCKGDGEYLHADYAAILEEFLESDEFPEALVKATRASWGGSGYSVELLPNPDHPWRVLWDNQIGNKYESCGTILSLPTLDDTELSEFVNTMAKEKGYPEDFTEYPPEWQDEYFRLVYENDEEELKAELRERLDY